MSDELFEELLLCARYGDTDDIKEYFKPLDNTTIVELLSRQDERGNTMFHFCCANGHLEILNFLLRYTSPRKVNEAGNSALHWAALNGHLEVVKALITAGCDASLVNSKNRKAVDEAESRNHESVVLYLLACTIDSSDDVTVSAGTSAGTSTTGEEVDVTVTAGSTEETDEMDTLD